MFEHEYQGGASVEVLASTGQNPLASVARVSGSVKRVYDKAVRGYIYDIDGAQQTKIQFPKEEKKGLGLTQPWLVVQLFVPVGKTVSLEVGIVDNEKTKRRLFFSYASRETVVAPLHARIPFQLLKRGLWVNACFDVAGFVQDCFRGLTLKAVDTITIASTCRLRKIYTLKHAPVDTTDDFEVYGIRVPPEGPIDVIPRQHEFPVGVSNVTQMICLEKVRQMEIMSGSAVNLSVASLDGPDDRPAARRPSTHIAYGSRSPYSQGTPALRSPSGRARESGIAGVAPSLLPEGPSPGPGSRGPSAASARHGSVGSGPAAGAHGSSSASSSAASRRRAVTAGAILPSASQEPPSPARSRAPPLPASPGAHAGSPRSAYGHAPASFGPSPSPSPGLEYRASAYGPAASSSQYARHASPPRAAPGLPSPSHAVKSSSVRHRGPVASSSAKALGAPASPGPGLPQRNPWADPQAEAPGAAGEPANLLASITNALKQYPANDRYGARPPPPPGGESLVSAALAAAQRRQRESASGGGGGGALEPLRRTPLARPADGPARPGAGRGGPLEAVRESSKGGGGGPQGTWAAGRAHEPSPGDTIRTASDVGTLGRSMSLPAPSGHRPREEAGEEPEEEVEEEPGIEGAAWTGKGSSGAKRESEVPADEVPDEDGADADAEEAVPPSRRPARPGAAPAPAPAHGAAWGRPAAEAGAEAGVGAEAGAGRGRRGRYWSEEEEDGPLLETPAGPPGVGLEGVEREGERTARRRQEAAPATELSLLYDAALGVYFDPRTNRHYTLKT